MRDAAVMDVSDAEQIPAKIMSNKMDERVMKTIIDKDSFGEKI
jgi:hypothetical protein